MDERLSKDRRTHFRLRYAQAERPSIRSEGGDFHVSEISEGGARVTTDVTLTLVPSTRTFFGCGNKRPFDGRGLEFAGISTRQPARNFPDIA